MKEEELKNMALLALDDSVKFTEAHIAHDQNAAMDYYLGIAPEGNGIDGKSQVVSRDMLDTIEWLLPDIVRPFTSTDDYVQFQPVNEGDEEAAEQESDYVNHVLRNQNNGFMLFYSWFKDALLFKVGVVKAWWEETEKEEQETYKGLTDDEFALMMQDKELELEEHTSYQIEIPVPQQTQIGVQVVPTPVKAHDAKFVRRYTKGQATVEPVPYDEFYVSRKAKNPYVMHDSPLTAHVRKWTMSELREQGYSQEKIEDISGGVLSVVQKQEIRTVFGLDDDEDWDDLSAIDKSRKEIWVAECYIHADYDGDGKSELRKVTIAGDKVLDNEEVDRHPFHCITPILLPHQFHGLSAYDLVKDIQDMRTQMWRELFDNLYLTNNQRTAIHSGMVNLDDMLVHRPQGIVRCEGPPANAIAELNVTPIADKVMPMLELLNDAREDRTGVSRAFAKLDPNVLKNINTGPYLDASQAVKARTELIVRMFAEGVKSLMLHIHELLQKHQKKEDVFKLRNQWVPINPAEWRKRENMSVNVGLGTGNKEETAMNLQMIGEAMVGAREFNLVQPIHVYNAMEKVVNNAGYRDVSQFCRKPAPDEPPPNQGENDPAAETAKMQAEALKLQAQADQQKNEIEAQKMALEHQQFQVDMEKQMFDIQRQAYEKERALMAQVEKEQMKALQVSQDSDAKWTIEHGKLEQGWEKLQQSQQKMMQDFEVAMLQLTQKVEEVTAKDQLEREKADQQAQLTREQSDQSTDLQREQMDRQEAAQAQDREHKENLTKEQLKAKQKDKPRD